MTALQSSSLYLVPSTHATCGYNRYLLAYFQILFCARHTLCMHIPSFTYKPVASHKWGISSGDAMTDEVGVGGEGRLFNHKRTPMSCFQRLDTLEANNQYSTDNGTKVLTASSTLNCIISLRARCSSISYISLRKAT